MCNSWTYSEDNSKTWVSKLILNKDSSIGELDIWATSYLIWKTILIWIYIHSNLNIYILFLYENLATLYVIFLYLYLKKEKILWTVPLETGTMVYSVAWVPVSWLFTFRLAIWNVTFALDCNSFSFAFRVLCLIISSISHRRKWVILPLHHD